MVAIAGRREAERLLESNLKDCRGREISAAYDAIDTRRCIVEHRSEVIGEGSVASPQDRIPEEFGCIPRQIFSTFVVELDHSRVEVKAKGTGIVSPTVHPHALSATGSRVGMTAVGRRPTHGAYRRAATVTPVDPALSNQAIERLPVTLSGIGLKGSRVPIEPKPCEIALQVIDIARLRTLPVEILETKDHLGPDMSRIQPTQEGRKQRPRMGASRRRGSKSTAIICRAQFFRRHCNRVVPAVDPS